MKTYPLHYTNGDNPHSGITEREALRQIANKYGVPADELVTEEDEGERPRTLVWLNETDADQDDGSNAVAELIEK